MKKNVLSIIILALLIVNIILTGIMMISMVSTNKKTSELVGDIAAVLKLELDVQSGETKEIPISQQYIWNLDGNMTIPLKSEEIYDAAGNVSSKKDHYVQFSVSFSLDTLGEGYETYGGENVTNYTSLVKDAITTTVSRYTIDECRNDFDTIKQDILENVKALFDKEFIYKVAITDIKYQ